MLQPKVEDDDRDETDQVKEISKLNSKGNFSGNLLNGESKQQLIFKIDLKQKCLTSVPQYCQEYQFCTYLNLSGNNLEGGIDLLIQLKRLEFLDVSHNKLTHIADVCGSILTLKYLNFSYNLLKTLPEWILHLEKVKYLNLSFNPLEKVFNVHLNKAKWKSIQICHLENIDLTSIPDCLQHANNLKELYLGNATTECNKPFIYESNSICKLPLSLPSSVERMDFSHVNLPNFEFNWKLLSNLKELKARGNVNMIIFYLLIFIFRMRLFLLQELFWPPEDFTLLTKLETCDLSSCKIFLLPKDIGFLNNLCVINLSFNKFNTLPQSVEQLHNLNYLDLYHSEIENIECSLAQLTRYVRLFCKHFFKCYLFNLFRLVKCDLWMNMFDPEEFLPNHSQLCDRLRDCLLPVEKKHRLNERVCPSVVSDDCFIGTDGKLFYY